MPDELVTSMANWRNDRDVIRAIRHTVFVIEQSVAPEIEWDGNDAGSQHALGRVGGGPIVATGRLQPDGKMITMMTVRQTKKFGE